jgi:hypothetical protein
MTVDEVDVIMHEIVQYEAEMAAGDRSNEDHLVELLGIEDSPCVICQNYVSGDTKESDDIEDPLLELPSGHPVHLSCVVKNVLTDTNLSLPPLRGGGGIPEPNWRASTARVQCFRGRFRITPQSLTGRRAKKQSVYARWRRPMILRWRRTPGGDAEVRTLATLAIWCAGAGGGAECTRQRGRRADSGRGVDRVTRP